MHSGSKLGPNSYFFAPGPSRRLIWPCLHTGFYFECRITGSQIFLFGFTEAAQSSEVQRLLSVFSLFKAAGEQTETFSVFNGKQIRFFPINQPERRSRRRRSVREEELQRRRRDRGQRTEEDREKKSGQCKMLQI